MHLPHFKNISIRSKLLLVFAVVSLLVLFMGVFGVIGVIRVASVANVISLEESPRVRSILEAQSAMSVGQIALEELAGETLGQSGSEDKLLARFVNSVSLFQTFIAAITWGSESVAFVNSNGGENTRVWSEMQFGDTIVVPAAVDSQAQLAGETNIYYQGFVKNAERAIVLSAEARYRAETGAPLEVVFEKREAADQALMKARRFASLTNEHLAQMIDRSNVVTAANALALEQAVGQVKQSLVILTLLTLVLAFSVAIVFARVVIVAPLATLLTATRAITKGNLDTRVHFKTHDEFETLSEHFNRMAESIKNRTSAIVEKMKHIMNEQEMSSKMLIRRDLELTRANEKLHTLDRSKSEFVSIAAHQMRTPLSAAKWSLEMIIGGDVGEVSPEQKSILMKGHESIERMIQLVNDLLDVDHIESGKTRFDFIEVQVSDLIENVVLETLPSAASAHVTLSFKEPKKPLPLIEADPERFRGVIQNLLENSIKYASGKEDATVVITARERDGRAQIIVADNGMGIPESATGQIFTKFYRGKNAISQSPDGSGLGLFIAKSIVERHGGKIYFESEEGRGTIFYVDLPIAKRYRKP